jgi:hypothetical protein
MQPDDEIMFGRVLDDSRACSERIDAVRREPRELARVRAFLELHGATLRSLAKWYPCEPRVRDAVAEWQVLASKA